jgi:pilus assembly protein Flp/PilA
MPLKNGFPHRAEATSTESQMKTLFVRFVKDESGVTAIEYGLIAGLISVVILVAVTAIGTSLQGLFQTIATALAGA